MRRAAVTRACDGCRRRKVKCDGNQPCNSCRIANLKNCSFLLKQQRKGRKGRTAKVLSSLRDENDGIASVGFGEASDAAPQPPSAGTWIISPTSAPFHTLNYTSPVSTADAQNELDIADIIHNKSQLLRRDAHLMSRSLFEQCHRIYFSSLWSTVPLFSSQTLNELFALPFAESASNIEAYALLVSFCGFIVLQTGCSYDDDKAQPALGELLLREALLARSYLDPLRTPSYSSVALTFLLYACHSALGRQRQAWILLRETTSLYVSATQDTAHIDATGDEWSRLFWLLLISERAHAIRRRRPITLQVTSSSPSLTICTDAAGLTGFRCLSQLFSFIDDNFISLWNRMDEPCYTIGVTHRDLIRHQDQISSILNDPLEEQEELLDAQLANIHVTQQWLHIVVWQLCITLGFLSSASTLHDCLTFRYPIKVARDLSIVTWKLPLQSMQAHGMGLTEKLFDVSYTLVDVMSCMSSTEDATCRNAFEIGPQDCLKHLVMLIARLSGGHSKYLPLLLTKVEQALPSMTTSLSRHLETVRPPEAERYDSSAST